MNLLHKIVGSIFLLALTVLWLVAIGLPVIVVAGVIWLVTRG